MMKQPTFHTLQLEKIVGGGQALGQLADGRKAFVWGGVPGETVTIRTTKQKKNFVEGVVSEVVATSPERVTPKDPESYLSTSPWQIYSFENEQHYKAALIEEAFELHAIVLPKPITVKTNSQQYGYRNKVEFSFWWDTEHNQLDLAFFQRGGHGKVPVSGTSLVMPAISQAASTFLEYLRSLPLEGRNLKTLLIRCSQTGAVSLQLYIKDQEIGELFTSQALTALGLQGIEIIYSNPKSPASVITEKLLTVGEMALQDTVLDVPFSYATEGFFQVNLPLYEIALRDMQGF